MFINALALPLWDADPLANLAFQSNLEMGDNCNYNSKKVEKISLPWVLSKYVKKKIKKKKKKTTHGFLERRGFPIQVFELLMQDESISISIALDYSTIFSHYCYAPFHAI